MHNGPRGRSFEKSNNFGKAMARLFKELNIYVVFILLAALFSIGGSILEIIAPDKLSVLTDNISKGLIVDTKSMEKINKNIENNIGLVNFLADFGVDYSRAEEIMPVDLGNEKESLINYSAYYCVVGSISKVISIKKEDFLIVKDADKDLYEIVVPQMSIDLKENQTILG